MKAHPFFLSALIGISAIAVSGESNAEKLLFHDYKSFGGATCTPYTTTAPDYSKLKFKATGVTNEGNSFAYVICALPMDADWGWLQDDVNHLGYADFYVYFRANTEGTDQCTLTIGTNASFSPIQTETKTLAGTIGETTFMNFRSAPGADYLSPPTFVCKIAPKHTLAMISMMEGFSESDIIEAPQVP